MGKMSGRKGGVGGLRGKESQGIHEQCNSMQERSCLRVTPTPPFIAFLVRALAPSTLTLAPFRVLGSFEGF